jgi:hypothetical protein
MSDLRESCHAARSLFHVLNGVVNELPKRAALVERGEIVEIANCRELCLAIDRLALAGEALGVPDAEALRRSLLGVLVALENVAAKAHPNDSEGTHAPEPFDASDGGPNLPPGVSSMSAESEGAASRPIGSPFESLKGRNQGNGKDNPTD